MEEKFVVESKVNLKNQILINRQELKSLVILMIVVVVAAMGMAIYNLVDHQMQSQASSQALYNIVLTVVMLGIIAFLPWLASLVQIMIYRLRHLDGDQRIVVSEDGFYLNRENGPALTIKFDNITRVIERNSHIKVTSGTKIMYLRKEDFVVGDPKSLMKYLAEVVE